MYYKTLSKEELNNELSKIKARYDAFKSRGITLDMSRGKPGPEQMDVSSKMFDAVSNDLGYKNETGIDCRNYGGLDGLPELKRLFSKIFGVDESLVIVGGNSSLNMMFDTIAQAMTHGFGAEPWIKQGNIKFLCPAPGYDRHFAICEHFGIELIAVENTPEGPNMDVVEELVKDSSVKGIWCVPKYSNPEGITYSDDTVRRIAALKPAAKDFRVFWDNAYAIHSLYDDDNELLNIYDECKKHGNDNLVIQFTSTSKITFPGAGVAAQTAGPEDVARIKNRMSFQTIGPDKLNQLRHARIFTSLEKVLEHMKKHADVLRPKFEIVLERFEKEFGGLNIAKWTKPKGGYFISLNLPEGCAKRTHALCKEAGLVLTGAGATFPYGKDPKDSNLRIAPSYPDNEEIYKAAELLAICVKIAVIEKVLAE
ncbi:MAG: aminotransferase class I/II-fold pyridoxal phosphate-dependent enzyme [Clostridia bacterium]|nr:aminotransferase class I/II-fold pyridoxal phosphate-dependent enzyme [Clostridia bacterium]